MDLGTPGFVARDLIAFDLLLTLSPLDTGEFPRRELSLSSRKIPLVLRFFTIKPSSLHLLATSCPRGLAAQ